MELTARLPVIGVVRTSHQELESTPIQAGANRAEHGTIEIAEPYRDGLEGLADFDYAWLLSWLHRPRDPAGDAPMRQVPFLLRRQQRVMGIFATRGPHGRSSQLTIADGTTPAQLSRPESAP
jgi:tRNA (Thr-GGU) A37 N-methylase